MSSPLSHACKGLRDRCGSASCSLALSINSRGFCKEKQSQFSSSVSLYSPFSLCLLDACFVLGFIITIHWWSRVCTTTREIYVSLWFRLKCLALKPVRNNITWLLIQLLPFLGKSRDWNFITPKLIFFRNIHKIWDIFLFFFPLNFSISHYFFILIGPYPIAVLTLSINLHTGKVTHTILPFSRINTYLTCGYNPYDC